MKNILLTNNFSGIARKFVNQSFELFIILLNSSTIKSYQSAIISHEVSEFSVFSLIEDSSNSMIFSISINFMNLYFKLKPILVIIKVL